MTLDLEAFLASRPAEKPAEGRLRLGDVVGPWRVEAYLGSGRSAEVYRVMSTGLGGEAALKLLIDTSASILERFKKEEEVLSSLAVPSLPRFFGAGEHEGRPWYAMEYLRPVFLPLSRKEAEPFILSLAKALGDLHEAGYLHCDLKPANVLLRRSGEPVLIDFGLVKKIGDGAGDGAGTVGYAAPEQLLTGVATVQSDVFALGKMLKAVCGKNPPAKLKKVIFRATCDDPSARYSSVAEFAGAVKGSSRWPWIAAGAIVIAAALFFLKPSSPTALSAPRAPSQSAGVFADEETRLAERFYHGIGIEKDRARAVELYRHAAEAGNLGAQDSLGCALLYGEGCEANPEEAVKWFARAAEMEYPSAMNNLAFCYLTGKGVPRDDHKGFVWAKAAADLGHAPSQTLVGECYLEGRGVTKDRDSATVWLHRAASKGNKRAKKILDSLKWGN